MHTIAKAAVIGLFAVASLTAAAQAAGPVYVVAEITVTDAPTYAKYAQEQGPLIVKHGGKFLARNATADLVFGEKSLETTTIFVFESLEKEQAWEKAPEQVELSKIRDKSAKVRTFRVEGCADCKPPTG